MSNRQAAILNTQYTKYHIERGDHPKEVKRAVEVFESEVAASKTKLEAKLGKAYGHPIPIQWWYRWDKDGYGELMEMYNKVRG